MRRGFIVCLCFMIGVIFSAIYAQEPHTQDTLRLDNNEIKVVDGQIMKGDTITPIIDEKKIVLADSLIFNKPEFKPDSKKAVIYSAILPGLGQIYNRKYWKLPIIYGGALGLTYAITWNGRMYGDYKNAYEDLVLGTGTRYLNVMRPGSTIDDYRGRDAFQSQLRRQKDFFRRNRDLAVIVAVGVYALCMIDAYVDAQLYDFNISPDLSINVVPVVWGPTSVSKVTVGLQCSINF